VARTFAIGDIHGDIEHLDRLLSKLPHPDPDDTLVFLGDYVDRGPCSKLVIERVREIEASGKCRVVCLRGNHEDAWLRVIDEGWPEFLVPRGNGCLEALRSFTGGDVPGEEDAPTNEEMRVLFKGSFFPPDVVSWMRTLKFHHEDEHAIYVHAGLPHMPRPAEEGGGRYFPHPTEVDPQIALLWTRSHEFFSDYRGKLVVVGHTATEQLPVELSAYTPADPTDLWAGPAVVAIDTRCGKGGFLTAVELPGRLVYESR